MTDPILITGAARSGTSLTAGLLAEAGVWTGECVPGGKVNPRGFFESVRLREKVTKPLLVELGADPLGVRKLPTLDDCERLPGIRERVLTAVCEDGYEDGPWLYKDAKLALLWPAWHRAFPSARWIIVRRYPPDIVDSCKRTHFMRQHSAEPKFWYDHIEAYLQRLDALSNTAGWWREIWPQKIIDGDWSELEALLADLGLPFDRDRLEALVSRETWHQLPEGQVPLGTSVRLNVGRDKARENIASALKRGLPALGPHPEHGSTLALAAGGPSLADHLNELRDLKREGAYVLAMNGTHDFLMRHRVRPWGMAMMDARAKSLPFVQRSHAKVVYLIASQCAPIVFDTLLKKGREVVIWHKWANIGEEEMIAAAGRAHPIITGGNTIGMTCLNIGVMLGFRDFRLFGFDSCYAADGRHHAYRQSLNDADQTVAVHVGGKTFTCAVWQARQAQDFQAFVDHHGHMLHVRIHGKSGLLAAIVEEAAQLEETAA